MILKEFRQMRRDKRTLVLMVAVPVLMLTLFGYGARYDVPDIRTAIVGPGAAGLANGLDPVFDVVELDADGDRTTARHALRDSEADIAVVTSTSGTEVLVDGAELFAAQSALRRLDSFPGAKVEILFNPGLKTDRVMVPALLGFVLLFVGMFFTSLGVVREREQGTLEQLAVTPLRPVDVIVGKVAPYFLVASLNLAGATAAAILLFNVPFRGSVLLFVTFGLLFLLVVLGLGVLISTASRTQAEAIQLAILVILPQAILSGMIFPFKAMPSGVRLVGNFLPLTHFITGMRGLFLKGTPLEALWFPLGALGLMATVVFAGSLLRFRRDLAPAEAAA